jgi:glyoxylase-like metal-dependent hydrolase (beta-lactamase superfamily II)
MSDASNSAPPAPHVDPTALKEISSGVYVITDRRVPLVPNIGIILGNEAALVVDTGMGPVNGKKVLDCARKLAGERPLILTLTHFHPEHGFGAQVFKGAATIHYNRSQRDELSAKGEGYLGMFKTFGSDVAAALEGTKLVEPDKVYEGASASVDLGGRTVEFRTWGLAHTAGDQVVWLPQERILFTGDLAEERIFPISRGSRPTMPTSMARAGRKCSPSSSTGARRSSCPAMATSAVSKFSKRCATIWSISASGSPPSARPARMPTQSSLRSARTCAPNIPTGRRRNGSTLPSGIIPP